MLELRGYYSSEARRMLRFLQLRERRLPAHAQGAANGEGIKNQFFFITNLNSIEREKLFFMSEEINRKVVILGSGPAGLTAAIYAARAELAPWLSKDRSRADN